VRGRAEESEDPQQGGHLSPKTLRPPGTCTLAGTMEAKTRLETKEIRKKIEGFDKNPK
jgi:hypothetical protein